VEKWIHKWKVINEELKMPESELMELVRQGKLKGFNQNYEPIKHYGRYHVDQTEDDILPGAILSQRIAYFDVGDIIAYKIKHGIQAKSEPPSSPAPDTDPPTPPENSEAIIKKHLTTAGKKGGLKAKIKQPIIEAVKAYMKENPKTHKLSNEQIAKKFCNKYNSSAPNCVTVDKIIWEIFCDGNKIYLRTHEPYNKNLKNALYSISSTTFRNRYIPLAKNAISTSTT
jgi:hypothetical protein